MQPVINLWERYGYLEKAFEGVALLAHRQLGQILAVHRCCAKRTDWQILGTGDRTAFYFLFC